MNANLENSHSASSHTKKQLIEESNRCVACGLCLPHCPTYRILQSEADSPRGRIAMINGVMTNRIPLNEKFILHMDRCLTCRACESVCPNKVAYGDLIDQARAIILAPETSSQHSHRVWKNRSRFFQMMLKEWITQPVRLERLRGLIALLQNSGILPLLRKADASNRGIFARMLKQLPSIAFPVDEQYKKRIFQRSWRSFYPAIGQEKGKVGLFLGCIARITDVQTLNAAIYVLNHTGYSVYIPAKQTCCGALYQHAGEPEKATQLIEQNRHAFSELDIETIITTASGCGVQLSALAKSFQITDISKFMMHTVDWKTMTIKPLAKIIAIHDPCSLRHVLHDYDYPYQLLKYIPDAQIVSLTDNNQCCGAAGTYCIEQPELSNRLLDDKINALTQSGAQLLATSNVGCAMHLAGGLRESNSTIEVLHPVTLLARQMGMQ